MSPSAPLLSICIPTYNRAPLLRQTLESIVTQPAFLEGDAIQVVVSDNCSTDETGAVVAPFVQAHPGKVIYQRHEPGIQADANFTSVLARGTGHFLKLHNDNLTIRGGALAEMLRVIAATQAERPVIFFTNGHQRMGQPLEVVATLSDFVRRVSIYATWIGGFGIWREDFQAMPDFGRHQKLSLIQTDVLFRLLATGRRAVLLFEQYFAQLNPGRKGGYNVAQVFGNNYLTLLKEYLGTGQLDPAVFSAEKKEALLQLVIPHYFDDRHDFQRNGFFTHLQDYLDEPYFHEAIRQLADKNVLPVAPTADTPAPAPHPERLGVLNAYWRESNAHNGTWLAQVSGPFAARRIQVGRGSQGPLTIVAQGHEDERLTIGQFVSIAPEAAFVLGEGGSGFPDKRGGITVGDDVRIGFRATILPGVTIGQGAVIAAGSVVAEDVPPYAVAGGNPGQVRALRFAPEVVDRMRAFDFTQLRDETLAAHPGILDEPLTPDNVEAVLARLRG